MIISKEDLKSALSNLYDEIYHDLEACVQCEIVERHIETLNDAFEAAHILANGSENEEWYNNLEMEWLSGKTKFNCCGQTFTLPPKGMRFGTERHCTFKCSYRETLQLLNDLKTVGEALRRI